MRGYYLVLVNGAINSRPTTLSRALADKAYVLRCDPTATVGLVLIGDGAA